MLYLFYDIVLHVSMVLFLPYFVLKMFTAGKYRSGIFERFGFIGADKLSVLQGGRVAWFHAVSVGETKAVIPLLKLFKRDNPEVKVVFSTVTLTGNRVATSECAQYIDALIYMPLDLGWVVRRVVRALRPRLFVVVEKELWPNLFRTLYDSSVPVVVVNGSISERSFNRYRALSFFFKETFSRLALFLAQTEKDASMATTLGVSSDRVRVTGNIKFDMEPAKAGGERAAALGAALGISPGDTVLVAGSTHAGEEKIIIDVYKRLTREVRELKLVLAPRHPERFDEVESIIKKSGVEYTRRSAVAVCAAPVVILDTMGELAVAYSLATVAFVGGTLVRTGGHNLLEPALFAKPVLYGPHLASYLFMARMLEEEGGGLRVREATLFRELKRLLTNRAFSEQMGVAALKVVDANRGSAVKALEAINETFEQARTQRDYPPTVK